MVFGQGERGRLVSHLERCADAVRARIMKEIVQGKGLKHKKRRKFWVAEKRREG